MISYIIPTRNRQGALDRTLAAIGALPPHAAEVVIADNASDVPPRVPVVLVNGIPVNLIFRPTNEGAAARNHAAAAADRASRWLMMLDDDSHPLNLGVLDALAKQPPDVLAVGAEIFLAAPAPSGGAGVPPAPSPPTPARESGGLPEVFVGCGAAIRRDAFLEAGGYDPAFGYYAEEYDLAAKLILAGGRIVHDRCFRVRHEKVPSGRNMDLILRRLVRNNAWVMQRYALPERRRTELREVITRYGAIASKERATLGHAAGVAQALATLRCQKRTPMSLDQFDRFTGLAEARRSLAAAHEERPFATAALIYEGKNAAVIRRAFRELGVRLVDERDAEAHVIGTLSPGPLLDAWEGQVAAGDTRLVTPWRSLVNDCAAAALQGSGSVLHG